MLEKLLTEIHNANRKNEKTLVVFDLDSTLFDVSPRLERILLDFAHVPLHKKKFPKHVPLLNKIKTLREDWGIVGALKRVGLDQAEEDFQCSIQEYWKKNFFSNHYLQFDDVYEGAVEFVQAIDRTGSYIAYLTGRDIERMGTGSEETLRKWEFPLHDRAELVLKPHKGMDDAQFKTDWFIEQQKKDFNRIVFFENEPVNLIHLAQFCPKVEMYFFESTHAGKAEVPPNLPKIVNFLLNKGM